MSWLVLIEWSDGVSERWAYPTLRAARRAAVELMVAMSEVRSVRLAVGR